MPNRGSLNSSHTALNKEKQPVTSPPLVATNREVSNSSGPIGNIAQNPNHYKRPTVDKCYQFGVPRHRSNQCPRRRTANLVKGDEVDEEE